MQEESGTLCTIWQPTKSDSNLLSVAYTLYYAESVSSLTVKLVSTTLLKF